jgi:hypothetical protein
MYDSSWKLQRTWLSLRPEYEQETCARKMEGKFMGWGSQAETHGRSTSGFTPTATWASPETPQRTSPGQASRVGRIIL